jgi:antirestriction protein ArdC
MRVTFPPYTRRIYKHTLLDGYAREELVVEMSAAFLCAYAGIEQSILDNSAAYIAGWLKALKNDKTMLVMAAAQGQKSSDFILNKQEEQQLDEAA